MILDELNIPNLSYEILEGSDRIGGRVFTHYFPSPKKDDEVRKAGDKERKVNHQYYDVGRLKSKYHDIS